MISVNQKTSNILVIFGANGDLTSRKLVPALFHLYSSKYLPDKFSIIGISRTEYNDETFREHLTEKVREYSNIDVNRHEWVEFLKKIYYQPVNVKDIEGFSLLKSRIADISENNTENNCFYYMATSPDLFEPIVSNLNASQLIAKPDAPIRSSVIVEKPIGHDYASSLKLNQTLSNYLHESQIYRIDHYMGKETVQNLLLFRFSNAIFEALWNKKYIDHIQITVAESIGVESRGEYYDQAGALRDMVQNHLMQILGLVCLEPPTSLKDANSIRNEKVKVLKSIRPFDCNALDRQMVRGQYKGFLNVEGVAKNSYTETYAALRLEIDNWRWEGVPILLRTGKCLKDKVSEVMVFFKDAPQSMISHLGSKYKSNVLAMQIQPEENISIQFNTKPPGFNMQVDPVVMHFDYDQSFKGEVFDAYERLLLDIIKGDQTLFIRDDEVAEAWKLLTPVLEYWSCDKQGTPLYQYSAGSWGPEEAAELTYGLKHRWRNFG